MPFAFRGLGSRSRTQAAGEAERDPGGARFGSWELLRSVDEGAGAGNTVTRMGRKAELLKTLRDRRLFVFFVPSSLARRDLVVLFSS